MNEVLDCSDEQAGNGEEDCEFYIYNISIDATDETVLFHP